RAEARHRLRLGRGPPVAYPAPGEQRAHSRPALGGRPAGDLQLHRLSHAPVHRRGPVGRPARGHAPPSRRRLEDRPAPHLPRPGHAEVEEPEHLLLSRRGEAMAAAALTEEGTSRFVQAGPIRVHYNEAGTGEPIIFCEGQGPGTSAWVVYHKVVGPLSQRYRCLLLDQPGYGKSDAVTVTTESRSTMYARTL